MASLITYFLIVVMGGFLFSLLIYSFYLVLTSKELDKTIQGKTPPIPKQTTHVTNKNPKNAHVSYSKRDGVSKKVKIRRKAA